MIGASGAQPENHSFRLSGASGPSILVRGQRLRVVFRLVRRALLQEEPGERPSRTFRRLQPGVPGRVPVGVPRQREASVQVQLLRLSSRRRPNRQVKRRGEVNRWRTPCSDAERRRRLLPKDEITKQEKAEVNPRLSSAFFRPSSSPFAQTASSPKIARARKFIMPSSGVCSFLSAATKPFCSTFRPVKASVRRG